ncbi:sigma-70 family RNA polymerase sigma factor [Kangiella sp. HD9-110m-PIT-SAG07]|nr:sigma-70 family RNA polymerase sigma factor [Kangiella sp. HD9-110m-PIT-SAG07]
MALAKALAQSQASSHYKEVNLTIISSAALYDVKATVLKESASYSNSKSPENESAISDEALMAGFAAGNMQAFETLYRRHKDPLLRFFLRQVNNRSEAEELFQDVWQRLIKHSKNYKSSAKFTTYLYHIARTRLIDHYRSQGRQQEFTQDEDGWEESTSNEGAGEPDQRLEYERSKQLFRMAIEKLPTLQREVVVMKFETGMTVNDIAEIVQEKPEAVKSRLRYGMDKLKNYLRDLETEVTP